MHKWIIEIQTDKAFMPDELFRQLESDLRDELQLIEVVRRHEPKPDNDLEFLARKTREREQAKLVEELKN